MKLPEIEIEINKPCPNCGSQLVILPGHGGEVICTSCGKATHITPEWQAELDLALAVGESFS